MRFSLPAEEYLDSARRLIDLLDESRHRESAAKVWETVEQPVATLRHFTDRLISLGSQPRLVDLLMRIEQAAAHVRGAARTEGQPDDLVPELAEELRPRVSATGMLLRAVLEMYEYVLEQRDRELDQTRRDARKRARRTARRLPRAVRRQMSS
jgi:hypothetical protein